MRRRARTDDNQAAIVAALRQLGCEVADLSGVGDGLPDLLVQVAPVRGQDRDGQAQAAAAGVPGEGLAGAGGALGG
jgi:hypothetical protein